MGQARSIPRRSRFENLGNGHSQKQNRRPFPQRQAHGVSLDSLREENEAADQAWHTCFDAGGHWLETAAPAAWRPPEDYAEQQDFFRTLENCLGGLPEDTARIFYLREIMGMEVEEICGRFGIGRDNCYVILHRARNSLRRCLQLRWFDIGA